MDAKKSLLQKGLRVCSLGHSWDCRGDFCRCWWNGWWQPLHTTTSSCRQPSQELCLSEEEWCWLWVPQFHCLPMVSLCFCKQTVAVCCYRKHSETCCSMKYLFPIISNNYLGYFSFQMHWVVPVHLLFKGTVLYAGMWRWKELNFCNRNLFWKQASWKERKRAAHQGLRQDYPTLSASYSQGNSWAGAEPASGGVGTDKLLSPAV